MKRLIQISLFLIIVIGLVNCTSTDKEGTTDNTEETPNNRSLDNNSTTMTTCTLDGVVLDNQNQPIPEVVVTIQKGVGDYPDIAAMTNDQGVFSFSDLQPGAYEFKFMAENLETTKSVVIQNSTEKMEFKIQ